VVNEQAIEQRQKKRLDAFNDSLPRVYQEFHLGKFPRPELAEKLLAEWQQFGKDVKAGELNSVEVPGLILFGYWRSIHQQPELPERCKPSRVPKEARRYRGPLQRQKHFHPHDGRPCDHNRFNFD